MHDARREKWQSRYRTPDAVSKYIEHLDALETEDPALLLVFSYHMHMAVCAGGVSIFACWGGFCHCVRLLHPGGGNQQLMMTMMMMTMMMMTMTTMMMMMMMMTMTTMMMMMMMMTMTMTTMMTQ